MAIIYFPLELLKERYTLQLSAKNTGWLERRWIENDIPYLRIEGDALRETIKVGQVLDASGRGYWATSQISKFLKVFDGGGIEENDVLFFDDFWHPGISALPYSFTQSKIMPKMYAFLYAQTVDPYDFTYKMRYWMRHFEIGIGKILDGIFVTSTALKDLLVYAGIAPPENIHVIGLLYNSEEVKTHWPGKLPAKKLQVIYTSRWDKEKRPDLFLRIVEKVCEQRTDIKFVISTSFRELKSNDQDLILLLEEFLKKYPGNLELRKNQTKEQYYENLLESKIQVNTADQDWVSWTLLEATTCGCRPLYPYFLSFPEALEFRHSYMYQKSDIEDAADKILYSIDSHVQVGDFDWVYKKYDQAWLRMYMIMKGEEYDPLYSN